MEMGKQEKQGLELFYGQTKTFILPSGYSVTIREQNGNDDDVLSNEETARDLTNFSIFISSLVIKTDLPFANKDGKIPLSQMDNILLRDKYYIIFASRAHSLGKIIKFKYDWGKELGGELPYEESLDNYLWDFTKPFPKPGDEDYSERLIKPYPKDAYLKQSITLKSGKELRYNFLNGYSEKWLVSLPPNQLTRNAPLKARNLELMMDGKWVKVENFRFFTKKEMVELHNKVLKADPPFMGLTEIQHPTTGDIVEYPIIRDRNFFYPEEE